MERWGGGGREKTLAERGVKRGATNWAGGRPGVVPAAAVKLETRTATVWPARRTEGSLELEKVVASAGTMRPLLSTPKVAPAARLTLTGAPRGSFVPAMLPEVGWHRSLGTVWH